MSDAIVAKGFTGFCTACTVGNASGASGELFGDRLPEYTNGQYRCDKAMLIAQPAGNWAGEESADLRLCCVSI